MRVTFETSMIVSVHSLSAHQYSREGTWRDDKELEICTAGLEFESGRTSFVRAWDNRGFTHSSGPTKCAFQEMKFPPIQKKKSYEHIV